jgi:hypothetical protein
MWGHQKTDTKGSEIENLLTYNNLCLLNNKTPTYLHPASGSLTAIDLAIGDPSMAIDLTWRTEDDTHGSDHFPIILEATQPSNEEQQEFWKLKNANWIMFQQQCDHLITEAILDEPDPIIALTEAIVNAADHSIPKSSGPKKHQSKPWFNDECKKAIEERKAALKTLRRHPTQDNIETFRIARARTRRTVRMNQKASWQNFISRINANTPAKKVWDMVRKIEGKHRRPIIKHLQTTTGKATSTKEIADALAKTVEYNSSTQHYSTELQKHKRTAETQPVRFQDGRTEKYNLPFTKEELATALQRAHDTAPGPDQIPYQLLRNLSENATTILLQAFNTLWENDCFPDTWHHATVIPIAKPGKDDTDPSNYRPIALTSCICKIMERMINNRLMWYLETNNLISPAQSGFRKQRGTMDHVVRLETFIREGLAKKQHVVAIFFDLEKAYDTTWKHGILMDLKKAGLKGHLPRFIQNFLEDRTFRIRINSTFSDTYKQEAGVPQGSILSTTLFNMKINDIVKCCSTSTECFLYVDDFVICYRSTNMTIIERQLQNALNKLQSWADQNGFKFSRAKTTCIHFCHKRKLHLDPQLSLGGTQIPVVPETRFLGVIFDKKLNFKAHIKYIKDKCLKALNLIKVVANTRWGADQDTLLKLYRALVRSKLDYGSYVYGSTRNSYIKVLEPVANQALRLCLGAYRTSPIVSLQVIANEPPLQLRRQQLALQYATKLQTNTTNPTYRKPDLNIIQSSKPARTKAIQPFHNRIHHLMNKVNPECTKLITRKLPTVPPWTTDKPTVLWDIRSDTAKK